jgi:hypothetical protein
MSIRQDIVDLGAAALTQNSAKQRHFRSFGLKVYDALAESEPIQLHDVLAVNGFIMS